METVAQEYKRLNCQAVAQLIIQFRKAVSEDPTRKESLLDYLEVLHKIGKIDFSVYEEKYGEWAREAWEANQRILEEHGRVKPVEYAVEVE